MLVRLCFILFSGLFIVSCSSLNNTASKYLVRYDFSQIKSYQLVNRESELAELQSLNDVLRNNIEYAVEQQLDSLGLVYSPDSDSDIIISYFVLNNNSKLLKRYNKSVNFCTFCLTMYQSSNGKKQLKMKPGSLIIDLVDRKNKRSVWRGVSQLKIKTKDNSLEVNDKLQQAVADMFNSFPSG